MTGDALQRVERVKREIQAKRRVGFIIGDALQRVKREIQAKRRVGFMIGDALKREKELKEEFTIFGVLAFSLLALSTLCKAFQTISISVS